MPDGSGWESVVNDPDQTYKKIRKLSPNTTYTMTIAALTDEGRGPEVALSITTVPVSGMSEHLDHIIIFTLFSFPGHQISWMSD